MTQIPEVGSVWLRGGQDMCRVVYADELTVLVEWEGTSSRGMFPLVTFAAAFQPAPRKVTHRRWINLYEDGGTSELYKTYHTARNFAFEGIVETRLIEWTV